MEKYNLPKTRFVRAKTVLAIIPWSKSTLWQKVKDGDFPRPVKISERITAWRCEDVHEKIKQLNNQQQS